MAKKKGDAPKEDKKLLKRLRNKYRLMVINENTFDERLSYRLSPLNVITSISLTVILIASMTILVIIYTPLKEYIPGYPSDQIRKNAYHASNLADSLNVVIGQYRRYNDNVQLILRGEVPVDSFLLDSSSDVRYDKVSFVRSPEDSVLRKRFEEDEKYNISISPSSGDINRLKESLLFFPPIRGQISSTFDASTDHLGIDITAGENEPILATLDGTVIMSSWTSESGYVIQIMHKNNLISVYKHNSVLLHSVGDKVQAGEAIAIIGNTGEISTGPHLHFELWYDGKALNPEEFITF